MNENRIEALMPRKSKPSLVTAFLDPFVMKAERIQWLMEGFIQADRMGLFVGDGGIGKGMLTMSIIADYTNGKFGKPHNVVFASTEEEYTEETIPRLIAAGANFQYIKFLDTNNTTMHLNEETTEKLGQTLADMDVKILYLDPLIDFFPEGVKENSESDVRRVLVPIGQMAKTYGITVVGLRHVPKGSTSIEDLIMGSKAWRNVSRSAIGVLKHPIDAKKRVMVSLKANNAEEKLDGRVFEIKSVVLTKKILKNCGLPYENVKDLLNTTVGRLEWLDETVDREEVEHAHGRNPREKEEIAGKNNEKLQQVREYFENNGNKVIGSVAEKELAKLLNCSERTARRWAEKAGVQFGKHGEAGSTWEIPQTPNLGLFTGQKTVKNLYDSNQNDALPG